MQVPLSSRRQVPLVGRWSDTFGRKPFLLAAALSAAASLSVVWFHIQLGIHLYWYYVVQVQCVDGGTCGGGCLYDEADACK